MLWLAGDHLATYADLGYKCPVFAMDFHPHDNFVAFATYGESAPIMLYNYDVARTLIDGAIGPRYETTNRKFTLIA